MQGFRQHVANSAEERHYDEDKHGIFEVSKEGPLEVIHKAAAALHDNGVARVRPAFAGDGQPAELDALVENSITPPQNI